MYGLHQSNIVRVFIDTVDVVWLSLSLLYQLYFFAPFTRKNKEQVLSIRRMSSEPSYPTFSIGLAQSIAIWQSLNKGSRLLSFERSQHCALLFLLLWKSNHCPLLCKSYFSELSLERFACTQKSCLRAPCNSPYLTPFSSKCTCMICSYIHVHT